MSKIHVWHLDYSYIKVCILYIKNEKYGPILRLRQGEPGTPQYVWKECIPTCTKNCKQHPLSPILLSTCLYIIQCRNIFGIQGNLQYQCTCRSRTCIDAYQVFDLIWVVFYSSLGNTFCDMLSFWVTWYQNFRLSNSLEKIK